MQDKNNKNDSTIKVKANHCFKTEIERLNKYIEILSSAHGQSGFESDFNSTGKDKLNSALKLREALVNSASLNQNNRALLEERINDMLSSPDLKDQLKTMLESMKSKVHLPPSPGLN